MPKFLLPLILCFGLSSGLLLVWQKHHSDQPLSLISPFIEYHIQELPLQKYSIPNLKNYPYQASEITILEQQTTQTEATEFSSYTFSYQTFNQKMTGLLNLPKKVEDTTDSNAAALPVIILIRGWVPAESYYPGMGTSHAGQTFAKHGYATLAIDFFGYGGSDPEPEDSWKARFIKPINIIELILSLQQQPQLTLPDGQTLTLNSDQLGIWAHSNGGQIALTTLEITSQPIPTTLWAPVTAPFPYSILFFSDENEDEGKEMRAWLAIFEKKYDVFDFSLTQHLDLLTGPFQIHHGLADEAALPAWSIEFLQKIDQENEQRREKLGEETTPEPTATEGSTAEQYFINIETPTEPIQYEFFQYPGADHNLQPIESWNQAIARDLEFFATELR